MKIRMFFYVLFMCFAAFPVWCDELNISLDKAVATEGETIYLTIEYTGEETANPELSTLQDDFQIVSTSSFRNMNYINGVFTQSKSWKIGLKPLKVGKITIKPIKLNDVSSNYVDVEIKETTDVAYIPDSTQNANSPYFQITQKFDTNSPYIQQQLTMFVTVYDSLGLKEGAISISEDARNDWIITSLLDKPIIRQDTINGKKVNATHFVFALFPQRSGTIAAPQITFDGYYLKDAGFSLPNFDDDILTFGVDFHNVFGQRVPVKMKTKEQDITVRPALKTTSGSLWLPLKDLQLTAKWPSGKEFIVGEAISREITFIATGMSETMVPQIKFAEATGVKQYPEKPQTSEKIVNGQLVTTAKINNVYIPSHSGKTTLPPIEVEWFDVETNEFRKAVIPEETINVTANPDFTENTIQSFEKENNKTSKETTDKPNKQKDVPQAILPKIETKFFSKPIYLQIFGAIFLAVAITGFFIFRRKKNVFRNGVIKALKQHNYKAVKNAILAWAEAKFDVENIKNFNTVANLVQDDDFNAGIAQLNRLLYADSTELFDTAKFIKVFKKVDKMKRKSSKNKEVLPNLYD